MKRAQADVLVRRVDLAEPGLRREVRMDLFRALQGLGHVDSIERYVKDPPDGPFRDGTSGDFDTDEFAIVRVVGFVTPVRRV